MARVTPDGYDILVWKLDETSGPYRNTGILNPNSSITDLNIQNTVDRNGLSPFGTTCANFPGTSNFPSGSSSTRNAIIGANTINPVYPITVSCWINLRAYPTSNNCVLFSKQYRDTNITNTWSSPFTAFDWNLITANGGLSWAVSITTGGGSGTQTSFTINDFPIPLQQWSHVGITYDGYTLKAFINGCQCITFSSGVVQPGATVNPGLSINYTDGINGFGPWRLGAITATGSGNKEEANYQISDVRVANIVRPLSYFQNIYKFGRLPLNLIDATQYYKLRAYDLACSEPTPVFWVDTEISLTNAPAFPCGGPYSDPEVIDTWWA